MKPKSQYHHGDLAAELLHAAIEHVRSEGASTFSLRDAAKAAGVTSGAAYRHFNGRDAILDEVVFWGFKELAQIHARRVAKAAPQDRLTASGLAYVFFATKEPKLFSLMYSAEGSKARQLSQELTLDGRIEPVHRQLHRIIADLIRCEPQEVLVMEAFAIAHGFASLASNGIIPSNAKYIRSIMESFTRRIQAS